MGGQGLTRIRMIQMLPKSFKRCRKHMRFLEMRKNDNSLTLMGLLEVIPWVGWAARVASMEISIQRSFSGQYLVIVQVGTPLQEESILARVASMEISIQR